MLARRAYANRESSRMPLLTTFCPLCPSLLQAVYPMWAACLNGDEPSWNIGSARPSALKGFGRVAVHGRRFANTSAASLLQGACQRLLRCLPREHPHVARTAGERLSLGAARQGEQPLAAVCAAPAYKVGRHVDVQANVRCNLAFQRKHGSRGAKACLGDLQALTNSVKSIMHKARQLAGQRCFSNTSRATAPRSRL